MTLDLLKSVVLEISSKVKKIRSEVKTSNRELFLTHQKISHKFKK